MEQFIDDNFWLLLLTMAWTLPWKGIALWKASQKQEKWWFIAMLVLNTFAALEILYIFIFSEMKKDKTNKESKIKDFFEKKNIKKDM